MYIVELIVLLVLVMVVVSVAVLVLVLVVDSIVHLIYSDDHVVVEPTAASLSIELNRTELGWSLKMYCVYSVLCCPFTTSIMHCLYRKKLTYIKIS
jgi:hypothetical protein